MTVRFTESRDPQRFKKVYQKAIYVIIMSKLKYSNRLFYKYRSIDEYTESLLINNELFFNHPDNFNDPFDCKPNFFHEGPLEMWVDFFSRRNMNPVAARKLIKDKLKERKFKRKKDEILYEGKDLVDDGVLPRACCFSERKDSLLMWGHYAENHKGICIGFKSLSVGEFFVLPLDSDYALPFFKVEYKDDKPPAINLLGISNPDDTRSIVRDFYLTKFTDWEYEHEYRLLANINDREGNSVIKFQKDALESVTFGLKIKKDNAIRIKTIIDKYYNGMSVKFYRTIKSDGKYAIEFEEIRDFDKYIKSIN